MNALTACVAAVLANIANTVILNATINAAAAAQVALQSSKQKIFPTSLCVNNSRSLRSHLWSPVFQVPLWPSSCHLRMLCWGCRPPMLLRFLLRLPFLRWRQVYRLTLLQTFPQLLCRAISASCLAMVCFWCLRRASRPRSAIC